MSFGNKEETSGRSINGEVSDWMFATHDVIAMSPEIGSSDILTNTYFITSQNTLKTMLAHNQHFVHFAAATLLPQLNITLVSWT
jgi:hypothetical protein